MITILATKYVPGYLPRLNQPSLLTKLQFEPAPTQAEIHRIQEALSLSNSDHEKLPSDLKSIAPLLLQTFVLGVGHGLKDAGFSALSLGAIYEINNAGEASLALPATWQGPQVTQVVIEEVVSLINSINSDSPRRIQHTDWKELLKQYLNQVPRGINSSRFLTAAQELGIPVKHVVDSIYQFGWGSRSHWFDSSITDDTGAIATRIAKQKNYTAWVLKQAGLPTPEHQLVRTPELAAIAAKKIGYPVVIKPVNLDGGQGVTPDLRDEEELLKAYQEARSLSPGILVEKHVEGEDYRIHVYQDQAYWVAHRQAGGVKGDGKRTIEELLKEVNTDPRRTKPSALLKIITLDDEARVLLGRQNLNPQSVPSAGHYVRLRRAANVASGGVPIPMLDKAHPDNLALAVRAARILRLNIAGVDLLIPDISKSWHESGAVICEVNAQPQMSPGLHKFLLEQIVKEQGRIPCILVLGENENSVWSEELLAHLKEHQKPWGFYSDGIVNIADQRCNGQTMNPYQAALSLIGDRKVSACIIHAKDVSLSTTGFPFDSFTGLVLLGAPKNYQSNPAWLMLAQMAIEMTDGPIYAEPVALKELGKVPRHLASKIKTISTGLSLDLIKNLVQTHGPNS
jgi:cyanophycin synthetase